MYKTETYFESSSATRETFSTLDKAVESIRETSESTPSSFVNLYSISDGYNKFTYKPTPPIATFHTCGDIVEIATSDLDVVEAVQKEAAKDGGVFTQQQPDEVVEDEKEDDDISDWLSQIFYEISKGVERADAAGLFNSPTEPLRTGREADIEEAVDDVVGYLSEVLIDLPIASGNDTNNILSTIGNTLEAMLLQYHKESSEGK